MNSYSWTAYDTRHGGTQTIKDRINKLEITTGFVKIYEGQGAGNWALRVKGTPLENAEAGLKTRMVFYVGMEAMDTCIGCQLDAVSTKQGQGDDLYVDTVDIHAKHAVLGVAEIRIPNPKNMNATGKHMDTMVKSIKVPETQHLWNVKCMCTCLQITNSKSYYPISEG